MFLSWAIGGMNGNVILKPSIPRLHNVSVFPLRGSSGRQGFIKDETGTQPGFRSLTQNGLKCVGSMKHGWSQRILIRMGFKKITFCFNKTFVKKLNVLSEKI